MLIIVSPFGPGYGRIILALLSFYYMPTNHVMAASMYILSGFLDAFDGHAARALNQCNVILLRENTLFFNYSTKILLCAS